MRPAAPASPGPDRSWRVESAGSVGWRVTWRADASVRLRDDVPVLLADGRRIGIARPSADGVTYSSVTTDPRVVDAQTISLGWSTDAAASARKVAPDTSTGWGVTADDRCWPTTRPRPGGTPRPRRRPRRHRRRWRAPRGAVRRSVAVQQPRAAGRQPPRLRGLRPHLASRGYVVVSINANAVNAFGQSQADLGRVGLMGHSRGGEGLVPAALQNTQRPHPYGIRGLFLIAPTDFIRLTVPYVSTAVVLPYCDGDVADLEGQHFLDDTDATVRVDRSFRSTMMIMGANHNFFNTEWSPGSTSGSGYDEWGGADKAVCGAEHADRLSPPSSSGSVARTWPGSSARRSAVSDGSCPCSTARTAGPARPAGPWSARPGPGRPAAGARSRD